MILSCQSRLSTTQRQLQVIKLHLVISFTDASVELHREKSLLVGATLSSDLA